MGRKRHQAGYRADQFEGHKPDPLVRVIAAHPKDDVIVTAVGPSIRIVNCKTGDQTDMNTEGGHTMGVRFLAVSPDGKLVLSGSDDKTCKLWNLNTHKCVASWRMNKKLSAGTFSSDSKFAIFSDKFGDVAVVSVEGASNTEPTTLAASPDLLLGHLCSIVTTVSVTPDNKFIATADRDGRCRITPMPAEPLKGAYEVQTYCLGHKNFIASAELVNTSSGECVLVTGSGDGTIKTWDINKGQPLSSYVASEPRTKADAAEDNEQQDKSEQAEQEGKEGEQEEEEGSEGGDDDGNAGGDDHGGEDGSDRRDTPDCAAVLCVAASRDGSMVATLVEGEQEVQILSVDPNTKQLALLQKVAVSSCAYPCRAVWDQQDRLWMVGGPPLDASTSLHIAVLQKQDGKMQEVTEAVLSKDTRDKVERRDADEEAKLASGDLKPLLTAPLHRKRYDDQEVEQRKRARNDTKESLRLAILRGEVKEDEVVTK